jgi:hypothetical protein
VVLVTHNLEDIDPDDCRLDLDGAALPMAEPAAAPVGAGSGR